MAEDTEAIVAACRAKHPAPCELVSVQTRVGLFVLRSPTTAEHRRFQAEIRDDTMKGEAMRNFFVTICAYPERVELTSRLDTFPGVLAHAKLQNAVGWLTGQLDELLGKSWPAP
jgi:hypothetical protein